jgi:hypothetical protein
MIKLRKKNGVWDKHRVNNKCVHNLVNKPKRKTELDRTKRMLKNNIKTDVKETEFDTLD